MPDLPLMALSIRQPWAWAILNAGKDVENRDWATSRRGPICLHAAKAMTKREFMGFVDLTQAMLRVGTFPTGVWIPDPIDLPKGGIVGTADVVDCVSDSNSPWFQGRYGFVLHNVQPVDFIACKGALGFFAWKRDQVPG